MLLLCMLVIAMVMLLGVACVSVGSSSSAAPVLVQAVLAPVMISRQLLPVQAQLLLKLQKEVPALQARWVCAHDMVDCFSPVGHLHSWVNCRRLTCPNTHA